MLLVVLLIVWVLRERVRVRVRVGPLAMRVCTRGAGGGGGGGGAQSGVVPRTLGLVRQRPTRLLHVHEHSLRRRLVRRHRLVWMMP